MKRGFNLKKIVSTTLKHGGEIVVEIVVLGFFTFLLFFLYMLCTPQLEDWGKLAPSSVRQISVISLELVIAISIYVASILLTEQSSKKFIVHIKNLKKRLCNRKFLATVFFYIGVMFVAHLIIHIGVKYFSLNPTSYNQKLLEHDLKVIPFIMSMNTLVIAPITEETIFRKMIFNICTCIKNNKATRIVAILASSILFALLHMLNTHSLVDFIIYLIPSIIFSIVYSFEGLKASIPAHFASNLVAFYV